MSFQIVRNDITRVKADAIVNTANPKPICGGGTDTAIYEAAGKLKLLAERKKIGAIARGEAVETPAFALNAKYIIHTVGPVWEGGDQGEFEILQNCYKNSLNLALALKCKSIAFPLLATGTNGFPKDKALQIAVTTIQNFLFEHTMKVILVVFDKKAFELSGNLVENVREFVDANYVQKAKEHEYSNPYYGNPYYDDLDKLSLKEREEYLLRCRAAGEYKNYPDKKPSHAVKESPKSVKIDDLVAGSDKTFQERLFEIIDERGLTGPQVYNNYVSKQVFSKIQSDKDYHPNKFTAIALCLSLHLDIDQTQDLIGRAGWTLSPSNKADLVVKGCILNHEYNIVNINIILFDFDCAELQKIK